MDQAGFKSRRHRWRWLLRTGFDPGWYRGMKATRISVTCTCDLETLYIPDMLQPLSIICVSVGVSVDTTTLSQVLNPRPWQTNRGNGRRHTAHTLMKCRSWQLCAHMLERHCTFIFGAIWVIEGALSMFHVLVIVSHISGPILEAIRALLDKPVTSQRHRSVWWTSKTSAALNTSPCLLPFSYCPW